MSRVGAEKPSPFDWYWIEEIIKDDGKPRQQDIDRAARVNGFMPKIVEEYLTRPRDRGRSTDLKFVSTQKALDKPYLDACWDVGWLTRCQRICSRIFRQKMSIADAINDVAARNQNIDTDQLKEDWDAFAWSFLYNSRTKKLNHTEIRIWATRHLNDVVEHVSNRTGVPFGQLLHYYKKSKYRIYWTHKA
ncbi:hypothetical protein L2D14_00555 [Thalassospiraceae bacterium LMO-JJ14]|nr:hypothetical protein L2D14_00555 [Thalassospiraceae bacterium LMO-JJ14]